METPKWQIPLQPIPAPGEARLFVLRLDLIDPITGGNKHFKLKYNLEEVRKQGHKQILTFGGAWSNHLAALAGTAQVRGTKYEGRDIIAVVRGEEPNNYSETLRFCRESGIKLHFVSREEYRRRNDADYVEALRKKFGDFYLLPEGGSNALAVKGCAEILDHIEIDFDYACCPVGSGGTLAGIASGLKGEQKALGFVALKNGEYLEEHIPKLATPPQPSPEGEGEQPVKLIHDYHFGGFAKVTPGLLAFKKEFEEQNGFELDYIYTSKMFYGVFDLIKRGYFERESTIVAVHTGGLQGNKGFEGS